MFISKEGVLLLLLNFTITKVQETVSNTNSTAQCPHMPIICDERERSSDFWKRRILEPK